MVPPSGPENRSIWKTGRDLARAEKAAHLLHFGEMRSAQLIRFTNRMKPISALPYFLLRQFDQCYLPIDLRHCASISIALFANKHPKKFEVRWRTLSCRYVGRRRSPMSCCKRRRFGKRQSRAGRKEYQRRIEKPFQVDLPDTSDFLLRGRSLFFEEPVVLSCQSIRAHGRFSLPGEGADEGRSKPRLDLDQRSGHFGSHVGERNPDLYAAVILIG
jgi:hypothetical protein